MAEVKGIFQSLSKLTQSPGTFLIQANNALAGNIDKKSFISLLYVILDPVGGRLRVARAGHCPMLYVSEGDVRFVQPTGIGLGLTSGAVFEESMAEEEIILKNGDICVFYTDGVTEARNSRGEEFGTERMIEVVLGITKGTSHQILDALIQGVRYHTGLGGTSDDITVVVLQWNGSTASLLRK
jgi:serine phosphatase RsbU (regulator of sigma subunit)